MRRSCVPNSRSHQHGPPLLGRVLTRHRVPRRQRSYAALRLPRPRRPPLRSSLADGLPRRGRSRSSPPHRCLRGPMQRRRHFYPGSPTRRLCPEERQGSPRCLGHPLRACRGPRPRRMQPPLARSRYGRRRLQVRQYPGHPKIRFFRGCSTHGPHARVPTHRRVRYRLRRKARSRPGRAHPWPGGFRTRWMTNKVSWSHRILPSSSTSLAWSHCRTIK